MKKIFTLIGSFMMSVAVFAAARPTSIVTIRSMDNADIRVVLDGKRFEPNDNSLRIEGIADGTHAIKVFRQRNTGLFSIMGKKYELVYNTTINVKRRTNLFITVERNGRISMSENKISQNKGWGNSDDRQFDYDRDGKLGDYDNNYGYNVMNDREFSRVLQSIDKEWLEGNKLKSATQIVRTNSLTAAQVKQLVQLFGFENNKLELAKQAYANTVDKRNYSIIFDVFSFNSSKTELERFIRSGR